MIPLLKTRNKIVNALHNAWFIVRVTVVFRYTCAITSAKRCAFRPVVIFVSARMLDISMENVNDKRSIRFFLDEETDYWENTEIIWMSFIFSEKTIKTVNHRSSGARKTRKWEQVYWNSLMWNGTRCCDEKSDRNESHGYLSITSFDHMANDWIDFVVRHLSIVLTSQTCIDIHPKPTAMIINESTAFLHDLLRSETPDRYDEFFSLDDIRQLHDQ